MSQENVEAIRRATDAYNRGDIDGVLEECDPEIEWHPSFQMLLGGEATVYRGHEGVREVLKDTAEAFTELQAELGVPGPRRPRHRDRSLPGPRQGKWCQDRNGYRLVGRVQQRQGGPASRIPRSQRGPRSRLA